MLSVVKTLRLESDDSFFGVGVSFLNFTQFRTFFGPETFFDNFWVRDQNLVGPRGGWSQNQKFSTFFGGGPKLSKITDFGVG